MLAMRTSLHSRAPLSAYSNSGHGYGYGSAAVSQGPRPASRVLLRVRSGTTMPRAFASPSSARPVLLESGSLSPRSGPVPSVLAGGGGGRPIAPAVPPPSSRQLEQAAAGGGGASSSSRGEGRMGGRGGGRGGFRGRGGSAASDDETLEELQADVYGQLPVWVERHDTAAISNAFRKAVQYRLADGGAATAARIRSGIIADLSAAYLPLVPRIRKAIDCRMPLWALGKAGIGSKGPEAELANALLQRLVDPAVIAAATPMDLSLALYALGKLREDWQRRGGAAWDPAESDSVGALADEIKGRLTAAVGHGFNAQDVSNSLWACAKLGLADAELLQRLAQAGAAAAGNMTPQALSNSLWALEALGCTGPAYRSAVQVLCGEALRRLRTPELAEAFKPQDLSNILLALEGLQLGSEQAELAAAVAAEGVRRSLAGYVAQDISNSAWALAKMGFGVGPEAPAEQRQWVTAALDAAMRPGTMATATPQNWSNLLYALALMRRQPLPVLLDAGAAAAMLSNGNGQNCANTLYALAVLQLRHAGLEAAVCGRLGELLRGDRQAVNHQNVANSLWAMAVLGGTPSLAMQQLAIQLARDAVGRWEEFTSEHLTQLWQAQQELGSEVAAALRDSSSLQAAMDKSVKVNREEFKPLHANQKHLAAALRRLEQQSLKAAGGLAVVSVQTGVFAPGVVAPVDAVVGLSDGRQVAVELVGPSRFLSNRKRGEAIVLEGGISMRIRHLRRAFSEGGGVLMVPYWEWEGLKSPEEQEAYLLRRLQEVVAAAETQAAAAAAKGAGKAPAGTPAAGAAAAPVPARPGSSSSSSPGGGSPGSPQLLTRPPRRRV